MIHQGKRERAFIFSAGHILINEFWQPNVGDMTMDESRFPTMKETIKIVHRRGFRIAFTLQPFIGTESASFREAVRRKLLVGTRVPGPGPSDYVPALSRYRSLLSAAVLDVTNKRSAPWFKDRIEELRAHYDMDCFYLDLGVAYDLPHHYKFQGPLTNPDHFMTAFTELVQVQNGLLPPPLAQFYSPEFHAILLLSYPPPPPPACLPRSFVCDECGPVWTGVDRELMFCTPLTD